MRGSIVLILSCAFICSEAARATQEASTSPPVFRFDPPGSATRISALSFSPDGQKLYVAGWNKTVQVWKLDDGQFRHQPAQTLRVPVGPGLFGVIQTIAVSPDGRWLAAGGRGWSQSLSGFRQSGYVWPATVMSGDTRSDIGAIYLFDTQTGDVRTLRGHSEFVRYIRFPSNDSTRLISVASTGQGGQDVRAWSVQGEAIGQPLQLPWSGLAPCLAAWSDGNGQLQVAVGLESLEPNGRGLRIWNPLSNRAARAFVPQRVFALEIVGQARNRRLVSGGTHGLAVHNRPTSPTGSTRIAGVAAEGLPIRVEAIPNDPSTLAAAVVRSAGATRDHGLIVIDAQNRQMVGQRLSMWKTPDFRQTSLAASAEHIAFAGGPDNAVQVHRVSDLKRGQSAAWQRITAPGRVAWAAFAERGDELGLALGTTSTSRPVSGQPFAAQDRVYVVSTGQMSDPAGWRLRDRMASNWRGRLTADKQGLTVTETRTDQSRTLQRPVEFAEPGREFTSFILRDSDERNPAIAVIASDNQLQPGLEVWELRTGTYLRQLNGHLGPITGLSFSPDGRVLLSVANDGTVRGWDLSDIGSSTIGRVGSVQGLKVEDDNRAVVVRSIPDDSAAFAAGLRSGDRITGILNGRSFEPVQSAWDLYLGIARRVPGTRLVLRVERDAGRQDVTIPVAQGADERKPVFTFALVGPRDEPDWLVWVPAGHFETSRRSLERMIGWHFNTGDDRHPTRFVSGDQLRERFFRRNLLRTVLEEGKVAIAPPVAPTIRVSVADQNDHVITPDSKGVLFVRSLAATVLLRIEPTDESVFRGVSCQVGTQAIPLQRLESGLWAASLEQANVSPGLHPLIVSVVTSEQPPRATTHEFTLRLQPPAPRISLVTPAVAVSSQVKPTLQFAAQVDIEVPSDVELQHLVEGRIIGRWPFQLEASGLIRQPVTLQRGENTLRLMARNREIAESLRPADGAETSTAEATVIRQPEDPPTVTVAAFEQTDGTPLQIAGQSMVSSDSALVIRGRLSGARAPLKAAVRVNQERREVRGIPPTAVEHELREVVRLQPGENRIQITVSDGKLSSSVHANVRFTPPLPTARLLAPREPISVSDETAKPVQVRATVGRARHDYSASLVVDDVELPNSAIRPADGLLSSRIELKPNAMRIPDRRDVILRLSNEWGAESRSAVPIEFLHVPAISDVTIGPGNTPSTVTARVRLSTPQNRPITGFDIRADDSPLAFAQPRREGDDWIVPDIAVPGQRNVLRVVAQNRDGVSSAFSVDANIAAPPRPPVVVIHTPVRDSTVSDAFATIRGSIHTETKIGLAEVVISRGGQPDQKIPIKLEQPDGQPRVDIRQQVPLLPGVNQLTVVVQTEHGLARETTSVTYLPPPFSVALTHLETLDGSESVQPISGTDGVTFTEPLSKGRGVLKGVLSRQTNVEPPKGPLTVRLWTNGFLQSVTLSAAEWDDATVDFEIPVVFNASTNRLRVEVAGITLDEAQRSRLSNIRVTSSAPDQNQSLHLVLVGVEIRDGENVADADQLKKHAERALRLRVADGVFRSVEVDRYGPLTGSRAESAAIRGTLALLALRLRERQADHSDVVMFYYRGREHLRSDGAIVLEDAANWDNPTAYPSSLTEEKLARLFRELPGAHVVLLDVESTARQTQVAWPEYPNLGLVRVARRTTDDQPERPLLSAVESAWPQAARGSRSGVVFLRALRTALDQGVATAEDSAAGFLFRIPDDLTDLVVGRGGGSAP